MLAMLLTLLLNISHAQVSIMVIDSGIPKNYKDFPKCNMEAGDYTGTGLTDTIGHGNNIANLILTELKGVPINSYCFIFMKVFDSKPVDSLKSTLESLNFAAVYKPDFVNYSAGGADRSESELILVKEILRNNTKLFVAAGNKGQNLSKVCNYYPACYNLELYNENLIVVGNGKNNDKRAKSSNYGLDIVKTWEDGQNKCFKGECMSGTSQSTAIALGKAVKKFIIEKYGTGITRGPAK
jgi:hypothetical protein